MNEMIKSPSNPIIKNAKLLHKKKGRWQSNMYFIEGVRAVEDAIASKASIEYILYSDYLFHVKSGNELLNTINQLSIKSHYIDNKLMKEISDTEKPQGVFAVIKFSLKELKDIIIENGNFIIILDRVQDPGNMGTIIRTADAMGASGIVVSDGCVDVFNPKTIRSTMGSIFHINIAYTQDVFTTIEEIQNRDINVMSTALETDNYCYDVNFINDFALIIGNEASGIDEKILDVSNEIIKIPMAGKAESLNAAIASAIVMYEAARQRQNF